MKAARTAKGKDDIGTEEGQPAESEHENDHCNRLRGPLLFCHTNFLPFSKHCGRILKMTLSLAKMVGNSSWTYRLVVLLRLHRPAMPIMCIFHVLRRGLLVRRLRSIPICCLKEETPFGYRSCFANPQSKRLADWVHFVTWSSVINGRIVAWLVIMTRKAEMEGKMQNNDAAHERMWYELF